MFEFITDTEERGQVGIGTLIVFIAMVLVAAIAAGVLINTAGFLQTQAEATGQESTDLVSERIDVSSSVGIIDSAADGTLEQVRLTVSGAPGADDIDLGDTTIQGVGPGGQQNLVFAAGAVAQNRVSVPDGTNETDVPADFNEYTTEIDVGVGELSADEDHTVNVTNGSDVSDTKTIDPTAGEDDQIVTVTLSNISASESDTLTVTVENSGTDISTEVDDEQTAEVAQSADSSITSTPGGPDTIDAPAEIDEDASSITVAVGNTTDANTLNVSDGNGKVDTVDVSNSSGENFTVQFSNINPAAVDSLEVTLVNTDNDDEVLDAADVAVVDSVQSVDDLRADEFAVEEEGNFEESAVLGNQDQYTVVLNPEFGALENPDRNPTTFGEGDSATLDLVSPAGSTTQVELRAPDLFNEDGQAVRL